MALYEVLEDGTVVPKAGKTIGNFNSLISETIYDKNDANKNWGQGGGLISKNAYSYDFSKYNKIVCYIDVFGSRGSVTVDLDTPISTADTYQASNVINTAVVNSQYSVLKANIIVSADKQTINIDVVWSGINNSSAYTESYYVYKIDGLTTKAAVVQGGGTGYTIRRWD